MAYNFVSVCRHALAMSKEQALDHLGRPRKSEPWELLYSSRMLGDLIRPGIYQLDVAVGPTPVRMVRDHPKDDLCTRVVCVENDILRREGVVDRSCFETRFGGGTGDRSCALVLVRTCCRRR